ncbi:hypothetical protein I4U23_003765 [Adineta vaga]|nr:hypothetical protein I4U23_003765 [Adineta vaga]
MAFTLSTIVVVDLNPSNFGKLGKISINNAHDVLIAIFDKICYTDQQAIVTKKKESKLVVGKTVVTKLDRSSNRTLVIYQYGGEEHESLLLAIYFIIIRKHDIKGYLCDEKYSTIYYCE